VNTNPRDDHLTLGLLEAIEEDDAVTQRRLARRLGVALGLANSYLRRCVRKGLVKIQQAPANRYLYYLTPQGFAEKGRLTAEYLSYSFTWYRRAGEEYRELLATCRARGHQRVVLCGLSELAEIASLKAMEIGVEVVGYHQPGATVAAFLGRPVSRRLEDGPAADAWLVTDLIDPAQTLRELRARRPQDRILVPRLLGLGNGANRSSGGSAGGEPEGREGARGRGMRR
jgi:DNA-binding MarR family transcriptional regulator